MLKDLFSRLCEHYTPSKALVEELWSEIEAHYSEEHRHYHTLAHIGNLIAELEPFMGSVGDPDMLLFSVFYHDVIYNVLQGDNEEQSAGLAVKRLEQLGLPELRAELCREAILATKAHKWNTLRDINLFTDADLSVLGKDEATYSQYAANVRKEYSVYPALMYDPGRKHVLKRFLGMERIYKTPEFAERYEAAARRNMTGELRGLNL